MGSMKRRRDRDERASKVEGGKEGRREAEARHAWLMRLGLGGKARVDREGGCHAYLGSTPLGGLGIPLSQSSI